MQKISQDKLAERIHQELMKLPERAAPETLVTQVLERIEQRQRQWWKQPWSRWPFFARMISLPIMLLSAAVSLVGVGFLFQLNAREWLLGQAGGLVRPMTLALEFSLVVANSLLLSLRALEYHWILLSAAVLFLMYLTCVAAGTVCFRVAVQKR
jgi:hypothetical protein